MEKQSQDNDITLESTNPKLIWLLCSLLILLFAPTIAWLFDRWTMGVWHNGHSILITGAVVYLIWKELKKKPAFS